MIENIAENPDEVVKTRNCLQSQGGLVKSSRILGLTNKE